MTRQAALLAALANPACYPHAVERIEVIETHISWVILTGPYAYKVKKAVDLGFVDFTTLPLREHFCREEVRLNRRLAPDLYLDVVAITGNADAPVIAGAGNPLEWAVKMREFDRGSELSRLVPKGVVPSSIAEEIADRVAAFHETCERDVEIDGYGSPRAIRGPVRNNLASLRSIADTELRERVRRLREWTEAEHQRLIPTFDARRANGMVRECHGDLHLANMALDAGRVLIFDCIEFNPSLRWIDVMSEVAFVEMDLRHWGRPDLARRFLNRYLERTGDYSGLAVLRYYLAYRALVRATVASIRGAQAGVATGDEARDVRAYLELAEQFTERGPPALYITHGVSGSGKTTVTSALLEAVDLIRIRSDIERKRVAGLAAEARSESPLGGGLYTSEATKFTYTRLRDLAETVLNAGYAAVLDATFLQRGERDACRALALSHGVACRILACRAPPEVLGSRVAMREQNRRDASEAGLAVLEKQSRQPVDLSAEELSYSLIIDTSQPVDVQSLAAALGIG